MNGVTPGGRLETFSLTPGEPRRTPDGRVAYPRSGAEAGTPVTTAGFIGMIYAPADELGQDMLPASWIRNGADGKMNGLSGCILRDPGPAKDRPDGSDTTSRSTSTSSPRPRSGDWGAAP